MRKNQITRIIAIMPDTKENKNKFKDPITITNNNSNNSNNKIQFSTTMSIFYMTLKLQKQEFPPN